MFNNLILVYCCCCCCCCCCCYFLVITRLKLEPFLQICPLCGKATGIFFCFSFESSGDQTNIHLHSMWVFFEQPLIALWNLQTFLYFVISMYSPYDLVSSFHFRLSLLGHLNLRNTRQVQRKMPLKQIILQMI